ncbi:MAG: hypothetical protein EXX96DRAFT_510557 [Benjaminiella poitrasii]|nr:MAG: hypothetical protein EXX96DRAFT_510557 [Benjaminiella poitrasii]
MFETKSTTKEGLNDESPSWLKQRTTIFSNTAASKQKVVDKELARLKNIGAVSSVWSNKFIQKDNNTSGAARQSFIPQPTPPKSPNLNDTFGARIRTSSTVNKKFADDVSAALESHQSSSEMKVQESPKVQHKKQLSNLSSLSSLSKSSLDLNDELAEETADTKSLSSSTTTTTTTAPTVVEPPVTATTTTNFSALTPATVVPTTSAKTVVASAPKVSDHRETNPSQDKDSVPHEEAASLWFQCETLKTKHAQAIARLNKATEDIEFYKRQLEHQQQLLAQKTKNSVPHEEAASLWFQCETLKTKHAQAAARLTKATEDIEFYKRQLEHQQQLLVEKSKNSVPHQEAASLWFECETLKTQQARNIARLKKAQEDIEFYKRQLHHQKEVLDHQRQETVSRDEAASLWFQCETLKTKFAQNNARLARAREDADFYKRQLEHQGEIAREDITTLTKEKEKEACRVRQLAELIIKQDKLLGEYEENLEHLTRLTDESSYLKETQEEMDDLRQELDGLKKEKNVMQNTISALRAELEMNQNQLSLMMAVSTSIQDEFDTYKDKMDNDMKNLLIEKRLEHEAQLKALEAKLTAPDVATRSVPEPATSAAHKEAGHNEEVMSQLKDQVATLMEALEQKDRTILDLQAQLKNQKMSMESQMMELNQSILEKDSLLMDFMSSRNTSREMVATASQKQQSVTPAAGSVSTTAATLSDTTAFYQSQEEKDSEARSHVCQAIDFMNSSSDEEEQDDDVDSLLMRYSSEEEEEEGHIYQQRSHYHQLIHSDDHNISSVPHSPTNSTASSSNSSTISFDSSEEEEQIAEIKHFSYSSAKSQPMRPVSVISTTKSLTDEHTDLIHNGNSPFSGVAANHFGLVKDTNRTSWPMPPPTPPPTEPLPPVPDMANKEEDETHSNLSTPVVPRRRSRSSTIVPAEVQLPRIIPLQKEQSEHVDNTSSNPVPPPRKDFLSLNTTRTSWMDDPESEEDELWCDTTSKFTDWNSVPAL